MAKTRDENLTRRRRRTLATPLLALPDVVGVGQAGRTLQVYLRSDTDEIRKQVANVVANVAPGISFHCVVSGSFRAG
jgi:hypothetical protein